MNFLPQILIPLFFSLDLFFFGPTQIFFTNPKEFNYFYIQVLPYLVGLTLASTLILTVISFLLSRLKNKKISEVFLVIIFALGFLFWLQGNVILWNYGIFDGNLIDWSKYTSRMYIDGFVWFSVILLFVSRSKFFIKISKQVIILLIVLQSVYNGYIAYNTPKMANNKKYVIDESNKFTFSKNKNVIVILLDSVQNDVLYHILKEEPEYQKIFDGFTYYRDVVGAYPTTYLSVPVITTGYYYKNEKPIPQFIEESYKSRSIFKSAKEAGYRVEIYPEVTRYSYYLDKSYIDNLNKNTGHIKEGLFKRLLDISFFRVLPSNIKKIIFNNQSWWFSRKPVTDATQITLDYYNDLLNKKFNLSLKSKILKFYHLSGAHHPFELNKNLEFNQDTNMGYEKKYEELIKGNLKLLKLFFKKLDDLGVYKDSKIVLLSDHGLDIHGYNSYGNEPINIKNLDYFMKNEIYNPFTRPPILLIKESSSNRGFNIDETSKISFKDIAKKIASLMDADSSSYPGSEFETNIDNTSLINRKRDYFFYEYHNINLFKNDYFDEIMEYEIEGPAYEISSWKPKWISYLPHNVKRTKKSFDYILGDKIDFGEKGNFRNYVLTGWSVLAEGNMTWTEGVSSDLRLDISRIPKKYVTFEIKVVPFLTQLTKVYLNDNFVGEKTIDKAGVYFFEIDPKYFKKGTNLIKLELPSATKTPRELGINEDMRKLGLKVQYISLQ